MTMTEDPQDIIGYLIERADAHREADEFVPGHYEWDESGACAIGCAAKDLVEAGHLPEWTSPGDHGALASATGIPEILWRLADAIFEVLSEPDNTAWPGRFLRAAHGRDLTLAWARFAVWLLDDPDTPWAAEMQHDSVRDAVSGVADLHREWRDTGEKPSEDRFEAARKAAWKASAGAASSAMSAAGSARAVASTAPWSVASTAKVAAAWAVRAVRASARAAPPTVSTAETWGAIADALIDAMEACPEIGD